MIESFLNLETGKQHSRQEEPVVEQQIEETQSPINMEKIIQENSKTTYRWESKKQQNFDDIFTDLVVEDCDITSPELIAS